MWKWLEYPKTNERWWMTVETLINNWFSPEVVDEIFELNVDWQIEEIIVQANMDSETEIWVENWVDWEDDDLHNQSLMILAKWGTLDDVRKFIFDTKIAN